MNTISREAIFLDKAILASIIILSVISVAELACLFFCAALREKKPPIAAVVPVFRGDSSLADTLDFYGGLLSQGTSCIDRLILVNYSADAQQLVMCREFCAAFTDAFLIDPAELEKILSKTFAFEDKV